jgi:asparagine synthase (glutamine-hydrolysing)
MCGLTGIWTTGSRDGLSETVRRMTAALAHRGPDAEDTWVDVDAGTALGHRRLAVIDLTTQGAQPMHSACGRHVLTFNGEIYNHQDLRRELEAAGKAPIWRGTSDTETLLAGFVVWGVAATLKRAVGMFAVALWDRRERSLTLARDRLGEKPLYYGWVGNGANAAFVFGSELKALRVVPGFDATVDRGALALFMQFSAVPAPYSIYRSVRKLDAGCMLSVRSDGLASRAVSIEAYWQLKDVCRAGLAAPFGSETEALEAVEAGIGTAVRGQMIADVPLGAFLSGGVDSSAIVALMQANSAKPVKTFTVGFDEDGFDEAPFAATVARHLGTDHQEIRITPAETIEFIPGIAAIYDEPFGDSSQIPTTLISRAARRDVTVVLTGDGGDELFGGYNRYTWRHRYWRPFEHLPSVVRRGVGHSIKALPVRAWSMIDKVTTRYSHDAFGDKALRMADRLQTVRGHDDLYRSLVVDWPGDATLVLGATPQASKLDDPGLDVDIMHPEQRMMYWDSLTYLPDDILTKVDRAAMSTGLETRVPFLDHRLIELVWRLPFDMKIRQIAGHSQTKWALRKVLHKYVPDDLIDRPKAGFSIPVGLWLKGPLKDWADALLDETRLRNDGYLDAVAVRRLWDEHQSGRRDWTVRLWNVLMFQAWLAGDVSLCGDPVSNLRS